MAVAAKWAGDVPRVWFFCPGCDERHHVIVGQWSFNGDFDHPTFNPSILVTYVASGTETSRRCHSYVRDGKIQFLGDCTHHLAGQTVDLPPLED